MELEKGAKTEDLRKKEGHEVIDTCISSGVRICLAKGQIKDEKIRVSRIEVKEEDDKKSFTEKSVQFWKECLESDAKNVFFDLESRGASHFKILLDSLGSFLSEKSAKNLDEVMFIEKKKDKIEDLRLILEEFKKNGGRIEMK